MKDLFRTIAAGMMMGVIGIFLITPVVFAADNGIVGAGLNAGQAGAAPAAGTPAPANSANRPQYDTLTQEGLTQLCDDSTKTSFGQFIPGCNLQYCNYTLDAFLWVIINVIQFLLGLSGSIALVMFIIGGSKYLFSRGDSKMITQGTATITNAVIGFVIIFSSWIAVNFIFTFLNQGKVDEKGNITIQGVAGSVNLWKSDAKVCVPIKLTKLASVVDVNLNNPNAAGNVATTNSGDYVTGEPEKKKFDTVAECNDFCKIRYKGDNRVLDSVIVGGKSVALKSGADLVEKYDTTEGPTKGECTCKSLNQWASVQPVSLSNIYCRDFTYAGSQRIVGTKCNNFVDTSYPPVAKAYIDKINAKNQSAGVGDSGSTPDSTKVFSQKCEAKPNRAPFCVISGRCCAPDGPGGYLSTSNPMSVFACIGLKKVAKAKAAAVQDTTHLDRNWGVDTFQTLLGTGAVTAGTAGLGALATWIVGGGVAIVGAGTVALVALPFTAAVAYGSDELASEMTKITAPTWIANLSDPEKEVIKAAGNSKVYFCPQQCDSSVYNSDCVEITDTIN